MFYLVPKKNAEPKFSQLSSGFSVWRFFWRIALKAKFQKFFKNFPSKQIEDGDASYVDEEGRGHENAQEHA